MNRTPLSLLREPARCDSPEQMPRKLSCGMKSTLLLAAICFGTLLSACISKYELSITASAARLETARKPLDEEAAGRTTSFFFLETAGASCVSARQACSIESAALTNHDKTIVLLSGTNVSSQCSYVDMLAKLPNFRQKSTSFRELFSGSDLEPWYQNRSWATSPHRVHHLSDALRLVVLWKFGGVYSDMDVLVLKNVGELRNSVARELFPAVGNSVLVFDRGHPFLRDCLKEFSASYKPKSWAHNGPRLLERVLPRYCPADMLRNQPYVNCSRVSVLPRHAFYPISLNDWSAFFQADRAADVAKATQRSYVVHLWNLYSKKKRVILGSGSAYDAMARASCPKIYNFAKLRGWL